MYLFIYLNSHLRICFINFREKEERVREGEERETETERQRGRGRGRENIDEREKNIDRLLPDQGLNLQPFGIWNDAPTS